MRIKMRIKKKLNANKMSFEMHIKHKINGEPWSGSAPKTTQK